MLIKRIMNNTIFAKNNSSPPYGQRNNWHKQNRPVIWTVIYITLCWNVCECDFLRSFQKQWSVMKCDSVHFHYLCAFDTFQALYSEEAGRAFKGHIWALHAFPETSAVLQEHSNQQIYSTHQTSLKTSYMINIFHFAWLIIERR